MGSGTLPPPPPTTSVEASTAERQFSEIKICRKRFSPKCFFP